MLAQKFEKKKKMSGHHTQGLEFSPSY